MRTTLDIDDDVLAAAKELARSERSSAGGVLSRLARQALTGLRPGVGGAGLAVGVNVCVTVGAVAGGFRPFASRGVVVTDALIDALRDRDGV